MEFPEARQRAPQTAATLSRSFGPRYNVSVEGAADGKESPQTTTQLPLLLICYFNSVERSLSTCSLQGFCDASTGAYAAVVYLKIIAGTEVSVKFVASKTRVSPVNKQTIPRLELLAALLLAKLITAISDALEPEITLSEFTCFTDSKISLYWIRGMDKEWRPFVQNRVNEIRRLLPVNTWRHCPGKENPADIPSRGVSPLELSGSTLWLHGPDWLAYPDLSIKEEELNMPDELCLQEMKSKDRKLVHSMLTTEKSRISLSEIIDCEMFGDLHRLLRVTAYVLKFINLLQHKIGRLTAPLTKNLTAADVAEVKRLWLRESQRTLPEEKQFEAWKRQFGLFIDKDGLYRCQGRLSNADLTISAKHPILLPKKHHLTVLLVKHSHKRVMHNGVKETLTELRTEYWIVRGRQFVRHLLHTCTVCRRVDGMPYSYPQPPPLPEFRVQPSSPFTHTGVDFAGPLFVKAAGVQENGKVWICLYTCCAVRAVHLDLVTDMTAEAFIRSFKRFTARRGFPQQLISDNGKTFKSAAKTIKAVLSHPTVQQHFIKIGLEWSFNVEKAPWTGGIFERMVKSAKRCLKKTIGRAVLTYDELLTAVTEVEMILNSRPLSYVSSDDVEEPLTPSHLLIGKRVLSLPDALPCDGDSDTETPPMCPNKRMRHLNRILDHFWKRWKTEYLLELRECHRYSTTGNKGEGEPISVGDIVSVHEEKRPRGLWRLAKVETIFRGSDGQARSALVRVHSSGMRSKLLRRPLKCLYPLEVRSDANQADSEADESTVETSRPVRRSIRAAALTARERIKACLQASDSDLD